MISSLLLTSGRKSCSHYPNQLMVVVALSGAKPRWPSAAGEKMNLAQLQTRLRQLGVRPKDTYRAALYIDYLNDADTYFKTTLAGTMKAGGLGKDYPFVAPALASANLLQQLADILDFFVSPAIKADLKLNFTKPGQGAWTYADYFTNLILDANEVKFDKNVQTFRATYPISADALFQL